VIAQELIWICQCTARNVSTYAMLSVPDEGRTFVALAMAVDCLLIPGTESNFSSFGLFVYDKPHRPSGLHRRKLAGAHTKTAENFMARVQNNIVSCRQLPRQVVPSPSVRAGGRIHGQGTEVVVETCHRAATMESTRSGGPRTCLTRQSLPTTMNLILKRT